MLVQVELHDEEEVTAVNLTVFVQQGGLSERYVAWIYHLYKRQTEQMDNES